MNLDIEILKILCELLDAMTRPEFTLFSVARAVSSQGFLPP
jgi:hypothetical protein